MRKGNKKEKWGKPKLIVLVRGDRQERVLVACKGYVGSPGPAVYVAQCLAYTAPGNCGGCGVLAFS